MLFSHQMLCPWRVHSELGQMNSWQILQFFQTAFSLSFPDQEYGTKYRNQDHKVYYLLTKQLLIFMFVLLFYCKFGIMFLFQNTLIPGETVYSGPFNPQ